ncbi:MAG: helix-turn-helix transcriptional regulator [Pseudomonadota bacterium]|nr:helix-turn-helix transcriptional regulator [Pseudomonadota bacterium]MDP1903932.1 helix-turn-helix transcriptional regulator [Pseudomonadota bacterium]MDP2351671.1 helix-turn-helix transcriptional regulator [Pseudomonadota bacterium]
MNIGGTIKALRELRGWSQEELGWRVSSSSANISRIETGKHGPGPDVLGALAKAFELKVYELFALAEGEPLHLVARLPDQAEEMLLQSFRAMSEERRLLLLQVGAQFAQPGQAK